MTSILIKSYGCSASMNDGEIMAGLLKEAGHRLVKKVEAADVIIINTCIVKGRTESRMKNIISRLSDEFPKKKLIVAGCLPQVKIKLGVKPYGVVGPHNLLDIVGIVEGRNKKAIGKRKLVKAGLAKISRNPAVNILQILEGCSGGCTYCIVKQAKPILCSFPLKEILGEVKKGLVRGEHEVWLTSQDNASYMLDKGKRSHLPKLIGEICRIEGKFLVRVGMMNPDTIMPVLDELIAAFKSPKVFKFLHIPVQSGNDRILRLMGRKYDVSGFKRIIMRFRKEIPDIAIATDMIVGFPTETEEEFMDSMRLVEWLRPDALNISRFVARPNTAAEKMKEQVHGSLTKERSEEMARLFWEISEEKNKGWIGWKGMVYVDEKGKEDSFLTRNNCYKPIAIGSKKKILGKFLDVKIVSAVRFHLVGEIHKS
jgi:threonylcarbamoyladenosine tRNA methylthiotransferase CDKAL1